MLIYMSTGITCREGVFYFRARIPTHLVVAYGRSMVSVSLHTRDPKVAKTLARERRVELDNALAELDACKQEKQLTFHESQGSVLFLRDTDIRSICERHRASVLAKDEDMVQNGLSNDYVEFDIDFYESTLTLAQNAYARGDLQDVYPEVDRLLSTMKLKLQKSSPSYARFARHYQQTCIEVYQSILERRKGGSVTLPVLSTNSHLSIDDIFKGWKRQRGSNPKTVRSFEQVFEAFKALCPTSDATLVRKADAVTFRDKVIDLGKVKPATLSKQIGFLRSAFQCAVDDDKIQVNPFAGVKVRVPTTASSEKPRLPFSTKELTKIFSSRIYQSGFEPRPSLGQACHWLPLLALFTGARLEELAQLETSDIQHHLDCGSYICIRRAVDRSKRTKNLNSVRNFPVHPKLVQLGFINYVASCKPGRLFPALRPDKYGILSTSFSTWFGIYLDEQEINDSTRVFHSFRHNFIERGKEKVTQVPAEVREAIVGHMPASEIEMIYGSSLYPLKPQFEAMQHIDWPELDLSQLRSW